MTFARAGRPDTRVVVADLERDGEPVTVSPRSCAATGDRRLARDGLRAARRHRARGLRVRPRRPGRLGRPSTRPAPTSTAPGRRSTPTDSSTPSGRPAPRRSSPSSRSTPSTTRPSSSSRFATPTRCAPPTTPSSSRCWLARWRTASGLLLTFMGKPLGDRGGSGLHVNLSFNDDAGEQRRSTTTRPTTASRRWPSHAIGGIAGAPSRSRGALRADGERLQAAAPGLAVGLLGQLGLRPPRRDDPRSRRSAAQRRAARAPPERRGRCRAHGRRRRLAGGATWGRSDGTDPGPPEGGNGLDTIDATVGVPAILGDALDELEADHALVDGRRRGPRGAARRRQAHRVGALP